MILSHEIPQGCKLYFGKSAKIKRELENLSSAVLYNNGYAEIITPTFAYLEHQRDMQSREVVRTNDQHNHQIALRHDSTIDTMRLLAPHLRDGTFGKRWFYIQPIFVYPTTEIHQIGVENLENNALAPFITMSLEILHQMCPSALNANVFLEPILLQLANVKIPQICAEVFKIPLIAFEKIDVGAICNASPIMQELLYVDSLQSLQDFIRAHTDLPSALLGALNALAELAQKVSYKSCIISPLYYAPMAYYTGLCFRFFVENATLILGGEYAVDKQNACGFGIYTDEVIQYVLRSESE